MKNITQFIRSKLIVSAKHRYLVLILAFALAIRLFQFGQIPFGVNRDEAALGYNAYSILKTGQDEHGVFLPYQLESFGDWKKPVYVYLTTIPIALFGLSIESTRLVSLVFSLLIIIYCAKIVNFFTKSNPSLASASIWTSLFLTLNPWHFFFSRTASETLVASGFILMGIYYFLVRKHLLGAALFILAMFTYHSAMIYVPIWVGAYWLINRPLRSNRSIQLSFGLVLLATGFLTYTTFFSSEKAKASGLVIFDLSMAQNQALMDQRVNWYSRYIYNRPVYISTTFMKNYLATFTEEFLLQKGSLNPSYNVPGFGYFYPIELLAGVIGLYFVWRQPKLSKWLLLTLLFMAPIPAALTFEATHAAREFLLVCGVSILGGLGIAWFLSQSSLAISGPIMILSLLALSALPFYTSYFGKYKNQSDDVYHGYFKSIVQDAHGQKLSGKYERIYLTEFRESPYIFYAFYNQIDPQIFHQTVNYYAPDFEGFVHCRTVDGVFFEERDEEEIALKNVAKGNYLNYSRPGSLEYWIKPLRTWDNLEGKKEIVSWQENQI